MSEHYSVIIIGAGLSGLHSAWQLQQQNKSILVLEARDRIGGRIYSPKQCDLGPAWLWPQMQPRLHKLTQLMNIKVIPQYTSGDQFYQFDANRIERYNGESSHAQSFRIEGGVAALSNTLMSSLKNSTVRLNTSVARLKKRAKGIEVVLNDGQNSVYADAVILALPPRIWLQDITFKPQLDANMVQALNKLPTWMATQAKMIFIYKTAFWREQNMSGEAMSQYGPLREINDAGSDDGKLHAISAFLGLNVAQRITMDLQELIKEDSEQAFLN